MYLFCAGPAAVHGALPPVCGHLTEGVLQQEHSQGQAGPGTAHQHHGQAGQYSSHPSYEMTSIDDIPQLTTILLYIDNSPR